MRKMTCEEKMAELEAQYVAELANEERDVHLIFDGGEEADCLREAWVLVKSNDTKFFIFERLIGTYKRPRYPVYRFGYYQFGKGGVWRRPQANPMFDADDWAKIVQALVAEGAFDIGLMPMIGLGG